MGMNSILLSLKSLEIVKEIVIALAVEIRALFNFYNKQYSKFRKVNAHFDFVILLNCSMIISQYVKRLMLKIIKNCISDVMTA